MQAGSRKLKVTANEVGPTDEVREVAVGRDNPMETTRRVVRETTRTKEYAPAMAGKGGVLGGHRNVDEEVARAVVREVDEVSTEDRVVMADAAAGGPLVMESSQVLGGGRAAPRRQPQRQAARDTGAHWMEAPAGRAQNAVLREPTDSSADPAAVDSDDLVESRAPGVGPALPTGEPCTCAYEWEVEVAEDGTEVVTLYTKGGIASSMRGAPKWMTWCIVCGGERDGEFRPENVRKYGNYVPEVQPAIDPRQLAASVTASVSESVLDQVAGQLASEAFLDALAARVAAKMRTETPV